MRRAWVRVAVGVLLTALAATGAAQPPQPKNGAPNDKVPAPRPALAPPPGTILQPGEYPIDLGSSLRLAGAENPELLLARQRVTEATALRQLAAAQALPNLNFGTNYDAHRGVLQQSSGSILKVAATPSTSAWVRAPSGRAR